MDAYRKNVTIELNNDFCMSVLIYLLLFNNKDSFNSKSFRIENLSKNSNQPAALNKGKSTFKLTFWMLFSSFVVYIFIHIYCFMNKCSLIFVWKRH